MRLSTVLKMVLAAVVLASLALIAVAKSIDVDKYKSFLCAQVRGATGRDLAITGPLKLKLGPNPMVVASGIAFGNAGWGSRKAMATAETIEAEIALGPLLHREFVVKRLVVTKPNLLIETDEAGHGNWSFAIKAAKGQPEPPRDGAPPTRFDIRRIEIADARLAWHDGRDESGAALSIAKLSAAIDGPGHLVDLKAAGDYQGSAFSLDGSVGVPGEIATGKPWPLHFTATVAGAVLVAEGVVGDIVAAKGLDIDVSAQGEELAQPLAMAGWQVQPIGPFKLSTHLTQRDTRLKAAPLDLAFGRRDAAVVSAKGEIRDLLGLHGIDVVVAADSDSLGGLGRLAGAAVPPIGPLKLTARLTDADGHWHFADIKGRLADSDFTGELSVSRAGRLRLNGRLASTSLAVADFLTPAAKPGEKLNTAPTPVARDADGRLFSAEPLPLAALNQADLRLTLAAARLAVGRVKLADFGAEIRLDHGRLAFKPISARLGGGSLTADFTLDASSGRIAAASLRLDADNADLGQVLRDTGGDILSGGHARLHVDARGSGPSLRAVMAGLDGEAVLSVGEGSLHDGPVDWLGGDVLGRIADALKEHEAIPLNCGIVRFAAKDGIATADRGIAIETELADIAGAGTIDLKSEALDIGIGITHLTGTLADPVVAIDPMGATLRVDAHPCQTALGRTPARKKGRR